MSARDRPIRAASACAQARKPGDPRTAPGYTGPATTVLDRSNVSCPRRTRSPSSALSATSRSVAFAGSFTASRARATVTATLRGHPKRTAKSHRSRAASAQTPSAVPSAAVDTPARAKASSTTSATVSTDVWKPLRVSKSACVDMTTTSPALIVHDLVSGAAEMIWSSADRDGSDLSLCRPNARLTGMTAASSSTSVGGSYPASSCPLASVGGGVRLTTWRVRL
mmetsp:Transcript_7262/g.22729  ORF Transcript_7262/g.22729 Transcript_7262/m.22729 type:complete len:224 (+) Transcript_7262:317-988(+)